jgi:hypothetical protein
MPDPNFVILRRQSTASAVLADLLRGHRSNPRRSSNVRLESGVMLGLWQGTRRSLPYQLNGQR